MSVKYFSGIIRTSVIFLVGWMLLMPQYTCHRINCPPPDFPEGGEYEPVKAEYEVGETVTYSCNKIWFTYEDNTTCLSNGTWSRRTPFCVFPTKLKQEKKTALQYSQMGATVIDGNVGTCVEIRNNTEEFQVFSLDQIELVYYIILCLGTGKATIKVTFFRFEENVVEVESESPLGSCMRIHLKRLCMTQFITVHVLTESEPIILCEFYFFTMTRAWCSDPPEGSVPNGQLEVGRGKAVLHCNEGFKEKDGRRVYATCNNHTWSYHSLQCIDDSPEKDTDIYTSALISGSVITTILIICIGLTIFLIHKKKIRRMCHLWQRKICCDSTNTDINNVENPTL